VILMNLLIALVAGLILFEPFTRHADVAFRVFFRPPRPGQARLCASGRSAGRSHDRRYEQSRASAGFSGTRVRQCGILGIAGIVSQESIGRCAGRRLLKSGKMFTTHR